MIFAVEKDGVGRQRRGQVLEPVAQVALHPGRQGIGELVLVEVDDRRGTAPRAAERPRRRGAAPRPAWRETPADRACRRRRRRPADRRRSRAGCPACAASSSAPPCMRHFQCRPGRVSRVKSWRGVARQPVQELPVRSSVVRLQGPDLRHASSFPPPRPRCAALAGATTPPRFYMLPGVDTARSRQDQERRRAGRPALGERRGHGGGPALPLIGAQLSTAGGFLPGPAAGAGHRRRGGADLQHQPAHLEAAHPGPRRDRDLRRRRCASTGCGWSSTASISSTWPLPTRSCGAAPRRPWRSPWRRAPSPGPKAVVIHVGSHRGEVEEAERRVIAIDPARGGDWPRTRGGAAHCRPCCSRPAPAPATPWAAGWRSSRPCSTSRRPPAWRASCRWASASTRPTCSPSGYAVHEEAGLEQTDRPAAGTGAARPDRPGPPQRLQDPARASSATSHENLGDGLHRLRGSGPGGAPSRRCPTCRSCSRCPAPTATDPTWPTWRRPRRCARAPAQALPSLRRCAARCAAAPERRLPLERAVSGSSQRPRLRQPHQVGLDLPEPVEHRQSHRARPAVAAPTWPPTRTTGSMSLSVDAVKTSQSAGAAVVMSARLKARSSTA